MRHSNVGTGSQSDRLASPGRRLAGAVLEVALFCLTLVIGWIIWYLIVARRGQSPAKRLLGMRVVREGGVAADLGWMLVRDLVVRVVALGAVNAALVGILGEAAGGALSSLIVVGAALWYIRDGQHRCLWGRVVGTLVIRVDRAAQNGTLDNRRYSETELGPKMSIRPTAVPPATKTLDKIATAILFPKRSR